MVYVSRRNDQSSSSSRVPLNARRHSPQTHNTCVNGIHGTKTPPLAIGNGLYKQWKRRYSRIDDHVVRFATKGDIRKTSSCYIEENENHLCQTKFSMSLAWKKDSETSQITDHFVMKLVLGEGAWLWGNQFCLRWENRPAGPERRNGFQKTVSR